MKFIIGVNRYQVTEEGTRMVQYAADQFEIDVPEDGSEFLASIHMVAVGVGEVLNLPLAIAPAFNSIIGY